MYNLNKLGKFAKEVRQLAVAAAMVADEFDALLVGSHKQVRTRAAKKAWESRKAQKVVLNQRPITALRKRPITPSVQV
jgi:hypothetical protein